MARELTRAKRLRRDLGDLAALLAYEREHRRVTWPIYMGTNAIVQLFTDDRAPARVLRDTVLGVARRLPPLRAMISRQLTGGAAQQA
jgi:2-polyprenyl-6-methoxyphenol hydroxylase-like FAD-dependent oxidoreductase